MTDVTAEERTGLWGALAAGAVFAYLMLRYFETVGALEIIGACGAQVLSADPNDFLRWLCSAYIDPRAGFLQKFVPTAAAFMMFPLAAGLLLDWLARKYDWFNGDAVARGWLGAAGAIAANLWIMKGSQRVIEYALSFKWLSAAAS